MKTKFDLTQFEDNSDQTMCTVSVISSKYKIDKSSLISFIQAIHPIQNEYIYMYLWIQLFSLNITHPMFCNTVHVP